MGPLRVEIVSSHPPSEQGLGMPHVVSRLSQQLVSWGHRVRVYYPQLVSDAPVRATWEGVEAVGVSARGFPRLPFGPDNAFSRRVARLIEPGVDVVMANNERGGYPVVREAKRMQSASEGERPLAVEVIHGLNLRVLQLERSHRPPGLRPQLGYHLDSWALRRLEGRAASSADVCVVPSETVRKDMIATYGVEPGRARVIYNGVEPRPLRTPEVQRAARRSLRLDDEGYVLSFLGHDVTRKGLDIAQQTVRRLRGAGMKVLLLNMGNDVPSAEGMRSLGVVDPAIKEQGLLASDVFFLPTHYDTLPLVVLEAASMGLPVVTTPGANVELGRPGEDFVLVEENRAEVHARVLAELLPDRERRTRLGEAGRRALGTRSYEQQAREYLELFTRRLGQGS
jgi:glycosyltransferase involved in cell wall biosynthesis